MRSSLVALGTVGLALTVPLVAQAADHIDSPAAVAEPLADITDLYAWMTSDASKLNLILDVAPFAGATAAFSDAVVYQIHISSDSAPQLTGPSANAKSVTATCAFYSATGIECWIGDEYVQGDASSTNGITSTDGKVKVFAGKRNDPFFFYLTGFKSAVSAVEQAAGGLTFDAAGCPAVDAGTSATLVGLLTGTADNPSKDDFAGANVLAIVIQLDKTLVNAGGDNLAVWAGTYAMAQ